MSGAKPIGNMFDVPEEEGMELDDFMELFFYIRNTLIDRLDEAKKEVIAVWEEHGSPCGDKDLKELRDISMKFTGNTSNADASVALGWLVLDADKEVRMEHYPIIVHMHKCLGNLELIDSIIDTVVFTMNEDAPMSPGSTNIQ